MTVLELANLRKEAGIRQQKLARKLGWNTETIVDIERRRVGVDTPTLEKIKAAIEEMSQSRKEERQLAQAGVIE